MGAEAGACDRGRTARRAARRGRADAPGARPVMSGAPRPDASRPLHQVEFVALMAMLAGTVAFSIDAMLPALGAIAAELSPQAMNRAQLVVTSFVFGMGAGTFLVGPLSDAFGRKKVILTGTALYMLGALMAALTHSLELLILARVAQGLGVSAARIVSLAIIRDLFKGREMARLMSFVMMVFALVPAVAPLIGAAIIGLWGWRAIFVAFVAFSGVYSLWLGLRLPEPLPPESRRPFRPRALLHAGREVLSIALVRRAIAVQTLCYGALFAALSSIQPIIDQSFGRGAQFPFWFGMIAVISGGFSLLNARLVMRLGMRRLIRGALSAQIVISLAVLGVFSAAGNRLAPEVGFGFYIAWQASAFVMLTFTLGNLNALAMEPLGHLAGMGASVTSGLATVGSVLLAAPVGLAFDGTPRPLIAGVLGFVTLAGLGMLRLERCEDHAV